MTHEARQVLETCPPTLFLVGTAHYDLRGRESLIRTLKGFDQYSDSTPAFVGVEYSEEETLSRIASRPRIKKQFAEQWPDLTADELNQIAETYGYDADSHGAVFPDSPTLFLDEGRIDGLTASHENAMCIQVCGFLWRLPETQAAACERGDNEFEIAFAVISGCAAPPESISPANRLRDLSAVSWSLADEHECSSIPLPERDHKWLGIIVEQLPLESEGWGIVIVGNNHIRPDVSNNLHSLLAEAGYRVTSLSLRPSDLPPV